MTSESQLKAYKKYHSSEKGKLTNRLWLKTSKRKQWLKEYRKTAKYKEYLNSYRKTEKSKEYNRNYKKTQRKQSDFYKKKYSSEKKRFVESPVYKLSVRLRIRLVNSIRRNKLSVSAVRDLGCSLDELKSHLENQFQKGMSWDNWGRNGWHIDHKIPISSFDLTKPDEIRKAVHYTNLQPLWELENLKKSNNIWLPSPVMEMPKDREFGEPPNTKSSGQSRAELH